MKKIIVFFSCLIAIGCSQERIERESMRGANRADKTPSNVETEVKENLDKPVPRDIKADVVEIVDSNGILTLGAVQMGIDPDMVPTDSKAAGPVIVAIFREISPQHLESARQWGVKVGSAYFRTGPTKFEYIGEVDLSLTNDELAALFGVQ